MAKIKGNKKKGFNLKNYDKKERDLTQKPNKSHNFIFGNIKFFCS